MHPHICFRILIWLFFLIISVIALPSATMLIAADAVPDGFKLPNEARIDIDGSAGNIELKDVNAGKAKWSYSAWRGDKANTHVRIDISTVFNKWTEADICFTPAKSGKVKIILMGKYLPGNDNQNYPVPVIWDNLTAEGAKIVNGDFEELAGNLPMGWTAGGKKAGEVKLVTDMKQVQHGKNAICVWHDAVVSQIFEVEADKPVTIHAWILQLNGAADPVSLSGVANMGLTDEVAGDRKGGWTDQGRQNDLSALPTGDNVYGNVRFNIAAGPQAAIVLRDALHNFLPEKAVLAIPDSLADAKYVYLLHATAWTSKTNTEVGRIIPVFSNGEGAPVPVMRGRDVADWWAPNHLPNAYVGWSAENRSSYVGLYVSRFELPAGKKLSALRFESAGNAMWGIAGVSLSAMPVDFPKPQGWTVTAGQEWIPFKLEKEIESGSALDLSDLLDAPAGKNGFARIQGEHFVFEKNGQRARFAGTNFSVMSPKIFENATREDLARLADRFARMGINLVRVSHVDSVIRKETEHGPDLDKMQTDKFDQLIFELKKRGIYITMDLFMGRWTQNITDKFYPGWKDRGNSRHAYESSFPLKSEFRDDLKQWISKLISHVNPYTGLALKDEPAILYLGLVNEDFLPYVFPKAPEQVAVMYNNAFSLWLKKKYGTTAELKNNWGSSLASSETIESGNIKFTPEAASDKRGSDNLRFTVEVCAAAYREMAEFLKQTGAKAPLVDLNMGSDRYTALVRREFPFVDNHCYWDHPRFAEKEWSLPYSFHQRAMLRANQWWYRDNPFLSVACTRQWGKPFVISEYDIVFPNRYRNENGLMLGSLSALQGWDALINFTYAGEPGSLTGDFPAKSFDKVNEAIGQATERQIKFLFLRGDVKPAAGRIDLWSPSTGLFDKNFSTHGEADILAFVTKTGVNLNQAVSGEFPVLPLIAGINAGKMQMELAKSGSPEDLSAWFSKMRKTIMPDKNRSNIAGGIMETETGETVFEFKAGRIILDTPKSRGAVVQHKDKISISGLSMDIDAGAASLSFHSLDGLPLEQSRHILAIFPTDVLNEGMRFENVNTWVSAWGSDKKLLRAGQAGIILNNGNSLKVWALSSSGRRLEQIPATFENGQLKVSLKHKLTNGSAMYWEFAEK